MKSQNSQEFKINFASLAKIHRTKAAEFIKERAGRHYKTPKKENNLPLFSFLPLIDSLSLSLSISRVKRIPAPKPINPNHLPAPRYREVPRTCDKIPVSARWCCAPIVGGEKRISWFRAPREDDAKFPILFFTRASLRSVDCIKRRALVYFSYRTKVLAFWRGNFREFWIYSAGSNFIFDSFWTVPGSMDGLKLAKVNKNFQKISIYNGRLLR